MIVKSYLLTRRDKVNLYKIYSSEGFYIIQNETGRKYMSAIDVENSNFTYTETDEKIIKEEKPNDNSVLREQENISSNPNNIELSTSE